MATATAISTIIVLHTLKRRCGVMLDKLGAGHLESYLNAAPKVKCEGTAVRGLCAREILTNFLAFVKLLKGSGGQGRNRTADAGLFRAALYQLSYLASGKRPRSIGTS